MSLSETAADLGFGVGWAAIKRMPEPVIDRAAAVRRARRELNALAPSAREFLGTEEGKRRASGTHDHARPSRPKPSKPPKSQLAFDWE